MSECLKSKSGRPVYYLNGERVSKAIAEAYAKQHNTKLPVCVRRTSKNVSRSLKRRVKYYKDLESQLTKSQQEKVNELKKLSEQIDNLSVQVNNCKIMEESYNGLKVDYKSLEDNRSLLQQVIDENKIKIESIVTELEQTKTMSDETRKALEQQAILLDEHTVKLEAARMKNEQLGEQLSDRDSMIQELKAAQNEAIDNLVQTNIYYICLLLIT